MSRDYLSILGITPAMSRMQQMASPDTLGPSFQTPTQEDFRRVRGVGFDGAHSADATHYPGTPSQADGSAPAQNNAARLTRTAGGGAECVRLEATSDGWIDLGGQTPRDMKVVNW